MPRVRVKVAPKPVRTIDVSESYFANQAAQAQPEPVASPAPAHSGASTGGLHQRPEEQTTSRNPAPRGLFITRKGLVTAVAAILLTIGLLTIYSKREQPTTDNPGTLGTSQTLPGATPEAQRYYNEISAYVELPEGEAPTVLNVSDANEVKKDNAALSDIRNGDKMLFFTKSRKLVVYRPDTKKVVAVVSLALPAATTPTPPKNR